MKSDPKEVIHTMGWPLPSNAFGGSWMYPMGDGLVSIGLVVGLDYHQQTLDVHGLLQQLKEHPLFAEVLEGGEIEEWGAKTIPEGGFNAFPERFSGDGILIAGDAAGLVNVPTLKGIHYAIQSGIYAARAIFEALKKDDVSRASLGAYDRMILDGYIASDLAETRNMRPAFKDGFWMGSMKAGLMTLTKGAFPGGTIVMEEDAAALREVISSPAVPLPTAPISAARS